MLGARMRAARFHDLNFYWRNAHAGYVGPATLPGEKFAIGTTPLGPPRTILYGSFWTGIPGDGRYMAGKLQQHQHHQPSLS